jgi:salicylate hydroxylase
MKVLISGAGIGGLTAALCLAHHGIEVALFERAETLDEIGAGIQLPPNAMKIFAALGLADALAKHAFQPHALEARMGQSGRRIFALPLAKKRATNKKPLWGAPYLHIHRADYIAVLQAALRRKAPDALHLGAEVSGYAQTASAVNLRLADGRTLSGDALIAADGLHSPLQSQMLGAQKPRFTGNMAWRATVPIEKLGDDAPPPTACVWMGKGRHCVSYLLRGGRLANFVGIVEGGAPHGEEESWHARGAQEQALADFQNWHPTLLKLLTQAETLYRWPLFDRAPLARWVDGRVALLGDAAHPMLPFMAQGAAMAVEDAWVVAHELAQELAGAQNSASALMAYQKKRHQRASRVQALSRANAPIFHRRSLIGQIGTYGPMWLAGKYAPALIRKRQDWLYGHDVTQI